MKTCLKCNNTDISVQYIQTGSPVNQDLISGQEKFMNSLSNAKTNFKIITNCTKEHLVYTCNTCGYRQAEDTIDNKKKIEKQMDPITDHMDFDPSEPAFKVGDWIQNTGEYKGIFKADKEWIRERPGGNTCKTGNNSDFNLWVPKENEMCLFWDNAKDSYTVRRFHESRNNTHFDKTRIGWMNIAPLELINILKRNENKINTSTT